MMILYLAPGFWILGVAGTTGGGLMMGFGIRALSRMVASGHWPTVEGRIISSRFVREGGRDRSEGDLAARIMYDYTVAGRRYVCEGVGFGATWIGGGILSLLTQWRAQNVVERYRVGQTVAVCYNPRRPDVSALERWYGVVDTVALVLFGAVLFLVGVAILSQ